MTRGPRIRLRSLGFRYVGALVLSQIVFGSLLGMVAGLYSVQAVMREREDGMRHLSQTIAASLLPLVADQDPVRIHAQLDSIINTSGSEEILCIRIEDGSGREIAESSPECTCDEVTAEARDAPGGLVGAFRGLLEPFTSPRVVRQAVSVEGLRVAYADVQFRPIGVTDTLLRPLGISGLVVLGAVVVSGLWGTFILMRSVVEPVGELRDAAMRIAAGDRGVVLSTGHEDEIGELADALDTMTRQLEDREGRLRVSFETLEEAYREQESMREQVQRMDRAKSEFVATASHELRSPLAVLQLYAEMLQEGQYGALSSGTQEAVESMLRATTRLSSIVATLMDVALLERGSLPLEFEADVRLDELVELSVSDAAALGARRKVSVRVAPETEETRLRADPLRLRQVLDNLLSNAVKYSEEGGEVIVSMSSTGDRVLVRVADRGRGVPSDRAADVFEPFVRLEAEDDSAPGGVGLGLAVSAKIARAHGGAITVEANQERGAVFVLSLPLAGPSSAAESVKVV